MKSLARHNKKKGQIERDKCIDYFKRYVFYHGWRTKEIS